MAKNIIIQQQTDSGFEIMNPQTQASQVSCSVSGLTSTNVQDGMSEIKELIAGVSPWKYIGEYTSTMPTGSMSSTYTSSIPTDLRSKIGSHALVLVRISYTINTRVVYNPTTFTVYYGGGSTVSINQHSFTKSGNYTASNTSTACGIASNNSITLFISTSSVAITRDLCNIRCNTNAEILADSIVAATFYGIQLPNFT